METTIITTEITTIESEALLKAVASELLVPDPEQSSLDEEEDNG